MKRTLAILTCLLLPALLVTVGCENDTSNDLGGPGGAQLSDLTCLGCHSSETMLQETLGEVASAKVDVAIKSDG
jgi:hypothetical protein